MLCNKNISVNLSMCVCACIRACVCVSTCVCVSKCVCIPGAVPVPVPVRACAYAYMYICLIYKLVLQEGVHFYYSRLYCFSFPYPHIVDFNCIETSITKEAINFIFIFLSSIHTKYKKMEIYIVIKQICS